MTDNQQGHDATNQAPGPAHRAYWAAKAEDDELGMQRAMMAYAAEKRPLLPPEEILEKSWVSSAVQRESSRVDIARLADHIRLVALQYRNRSSARL
jgi:hypothetical protein